MFFKAINFGKADARTEGEYYPDLLSKGYLNKSNVAEKALNEDTFLFLGYKGSGKSSLSEHLRLQATDSVVDSQLLKDFSFKEFDRMLENDDKPIKYKKLWDWLLCVKVFEDLYSDSSAAIKTQENINKVIDILTQLGVFPVLKIASLIKKEITDSIKTTIEHLELSRTVSRSSIDVDVELLTDYIKELILSFRESAPHVMIIDDLDDILNPKGLQFGVISALINEAKELNRFFRQNYIPYKILVLCRTDMFDRLPDPNKNKIKQDNSFTFTWYREGINKPEDSDLIRLINIRAQLVYPELEDVFQSFFPKTYKGAPIYSALLDFTRHTPRDFIQLINHIQNQCEDCTEKVTSVEIDKGINEYSSEYFKREIDDEMTGYIPGTAIESIFNAISSLHSREFSYEDLKKACEYRTALKSLNIDDITKLLYECSAIGHSFSYDGGITSRLSFKYRNPSSAFNPNDRILLHKGLWKALNVSY